MDHTRPRSALSGKAGGSTFPPCLVGGRSSARMISQRFYRPTVSFRRTKIENAYPAAINGPREITLSIPEIL